jgi:hypothetical protein
MLGRQDVETPVGTSFSIVETPAPSASAPAVQSHSVVDPADEAPGRTSGRGLRLAVWLLAAGAVATGLAAWAVARRQRRVH